MKGILVVGFVLLFSSSLGAITFDLKTKIEQKAILVPLKIGAEYFLLSAGHRILDVGEDWAVWIKDRQAKIVGKQVQVRVLVKVSDTTGVFEKPSLAETWVTYTFEGELPATVSTDEAATKFLRTKLEILGATALEEGRVGGKAVAQAILELVGRAKARKTSGGS